MALEELSTSTAYDLQEKFYDHFGAQHWDEYYFENFITLKEKIAYAFYGPPSREIIKIDSKDERDSDDIGYSDEQMEIVNRIYKKIEPFKKYSSDGKRIYMTLLFACYIPVDKNISYNSVNIIKYAHLKSDKMFTSPVFKIRKCIRTENSTIPPCCCYVDDLGRVYKNWRDYLKSNKMPKGVLILPKDGLYSGTGEDDEFRLNLDIVLSPASSTLNKAINVGNKVGTGIAVASTGVFLTTLFAPVAVPIVIGATISSVAFGVFGTSVSSRTLIDRSTHEQSISLSDSEARGCWINIGASSLAMISTASGRILSTAVSRGVNIGQIAKTVHNGILIANVTANGVGITNGFHSMVVRCRDNGETPSTLEVFQLTSSILFFSHSLVSVQTASRIIEKTQVSQIEQQRSALRSNRQRKMFDKMAGETRRRNGDIVKGNTEIIRSMRQITDKDSFFSYALRMNKDLNRNNVKISFGDNGEVLFNEAHGVSPEALSSLNSKQRSAYLSNIEPSQLSTPNAPTRIPYPKPIDGVLQTLNSTLPACKYVCEILVDAKFEFKQTTHIFIKNTIEKLIHMTTEPISKWLSPIIIETSKSLGISDDGLIKKFLNVTIDCMATKVKEGLEPAIDVLIKFFESWFHKMFDKAIKSKSRECSICKCRQF